MFGIVQCGRYGRCPTNKFGHGYEGEIHVHDEDIVVCYFCGKFRHMMSKCKDIHKKDEFNEFRTNKKGIQKDLVT